ncbi:FOG: GGDEF domain [Paenibacillus sp. JCM 10914]|nr:FOG: GGDEF domain [Paenibacillus sp. JCM 10914]
MTIPELSEGVVPTVWRALWIDILHFVCICVLLFFIWVLYYKTKQLTKQTALYLCLGGSFYIAGTLLHIYLGGFMHVDIGSYLYPLHSLSVFFVALAGGQHIQAKERLLQERRSRPLGTLLVKYVLPYSVLSFMFVLLAQRFGGWNSLFTGLSLCVVLILVRQVLIQIENDRLLEQLHSSFKQSESLAHRDDLTGLYNRRYFNAQLSRSLHRADRAGSRVALLYMDLNRFKSVNDRYGHRTGDLLIQKVAQRLQSLESKGILVSRLGGDEFTVMICPAGEDQELIWMAEEIWILLSEPYDLEGHDIRTSPSIGIAVYPDHAKNDQELIGRADAAMYAAKERHARWHFDVEQTMMLQLLEQKLD